MTALLVGFALFLPTGRRLGRSPPALLSKVPRVGSTFPPSTGSHGRPRIGRPAIPCASGAIGEAYPARARIFSDRLRRIYIRLSYSSPSGLGSRSKARDPFFLRVRLESSFRNNQLSIHVWQKWGDSHGKHLRGWSSAVDSPPHCVFIWLSARAGLCLVAPLRPGCERP